VISDDRASIGERKAPRGWKVQSRLPRAETAMRQNCRTDKFRNDKIVWMTLISNDFLQLQLGEPWSMRLLPAQKRKAFCASRPSWQVK
jgi:hypothetical protein